MRLAICVVSVLWIAQIPLDRRVFPSVGAIVAFRVSELISNAAALVLLRRARGLSPVQAIAAGWTVWQCVTGALGASVAIAPQHLMLVGSYAASFIGLLSVVPFTGAVAASLSTVLSALLLAALASRGWGATDLSIATLAGAVSMAWVVGAAFSRDRIERSEHEARRELAEAHAALRALEATRSRLFANLSHDFRTPLAVIRAEAERLLAEPDAADREPALERVAHNATVLADLADQLLELSRLDVAKLPNAPTNVDVAQVARDVVAQLQPADPRVSLRVRTADASPVVARVDVRHVRRMLQNLVGNALRAMRRRAGSVDVAIAMDGERVRITVADDGPGVAAERRATLFERFAHFDAEGSLASGVGLALAHELATLARGSLRLTDAPRTTFELALPRAEGPADPHVAAATSAPRPHAPVAPKPDARPERPSPPHERARLLVVEDHPEMAAVLERLCGKRFDVVLAASVAEALDALKTARPEAVLCDVMLPDGSGYDVLAAARRSHETHNLPVVLVSALSEPEEQARGLAAGADDYLAKPFSSEELLARVAGAVARGAEKRRALECQREDLLMEIHDGIAAGFVRASALLAGFTGDDPRGCVAAASAAIGEGLEEARTLMNVVSRGAIPTGELVASLRRAVSDACEPAGIAVHVSTRDVDSVEPVPPAVEHALRRITREAVTNVLRHASARHVELSIERRNGGVKLCLLDDGRGVSAPAPGRGLGNMQRRAERLGGNLEIAPRDGGGTAVRARLPLHAQSPRAARATSSSSFPPL